MIRLPHLNEYDTQNRLSTLADLSKLHTFHYLNDILETSLFNPPTETVFDGSMLSEATNLRKFSVDLVCHGVNSFVQNLTTERPGNRTLYEFEVLSEDILNIV